MFNIARNQIVTLSRGDTAEMQIFINIGTELDPTWYVLQEGDKVYFALMEPNQDFECALIKKVYTVEDLIYDPPEEPIPYVKLHMSPADTENLLSGTYYYMVKLARLTESETEPYIVDTMVSKKKFIIID